MANATDAEMASLDGLVSSLRAVEQTLQGMLAARDGMLALANRLALTIAERGDGVDASDITLRSVAAELASALRVSDRTMQRRMLAAEIVVERFPEVWQAQAAGRITAGHARVIVDAGAYIDDAAARAAYSARVLEFAEDESPNRVRMIAERVAQQYQARSLEERHEDARGNRGTWVTDHPDAMSELHVFGPSVLIHGAHDRLTQMAKALAPKRGSAASESAASESAAGHDGADRRTLSQRRLDLAMDLLLTGRPAGHDTADGLLSAIVAQVAVTVPVLTLLGQDGPAAEIDGRAPIDAATAQLLADASTGWDRVLTHPIDGRVLAVDRYRPSQALRRKLRGRDQRCRFPGCGMPVRTGDLDHTVDAAWGGATSEDNLEALCRRHHVLKHQTPWHVQQLDDGLLEWTSPTGRTYIDRPPPPNTVVFTAADEASADVGIGRPPFG